LDQNPVYGSFELKPFGSTILIWNGTLKAETEVICSKEVYHYGDIIEIQGKNLGQGSYDQYTVLVFPDGSYFFNIGNTLFTMDIKPWETTPELNNTPFTILHLPYTTEIPLGKYQIHNILVPAGTDPLENADEWVADSKSFYIEA